MFKPMLLISLSLYSLWSQADSIADSMQNFYNRIGGSSNITPAGSYAGQMSGHYTLGGISTRSHSENFQPFSMTGPGMRMGCGGVDLHMGAMSWIKAAEFKRLMQSITTSGMNYAYMITFETLCPLCKKTMDQLNKIAQELSQWNIDACNTSAALIGGILPKTEAVQKVVCENISTEQGTLNDRARSRQACGAGGEAERYLERARNNDDERSKKFRDYLTNKGNLAWMVLEKNKFAERAPNDLKELIMTLSGSIIINDNNDQSKQVWLAPKAAEQTLINALMYGGHSNKAKIYKCDTHVKYGCLNPTYNKDLIINSEFSFVGKVKSSLVSIQNKIRADRGTLTTQEIELINTAKIPLLKAINVQSAYAFASEIIKLEDYAELIASDLLEDYLTELLDVVQAGVRTINASDQVISDFIQGVQDARSRLIYIKSRDVKRINQALDLVQKIQVLEKMLAGEFSADLARSIDWAVGRR